MSKRNMNSRPGCAGAARASARLLRRVLVVAGMAAVAAAGGCASVKTTRVDPARPDAAKGLRYALPKPFALITPMADGQVEFDFLYLRDDDNTYAIEATNQFGATTFTPVIGDDGMLSSLAYIANTAAVPAKAVSTAGTVTKAVLDERIALRTAQQSAVATAQGNVDTARVTRDKAAAKLKALEGPPAAAADKLEEARVALAEAEADLAAKRKILDRVRNSRAAAAPGSNTADDPAKTEEGASQPAESPKPGNSGLPAAKRVAGPYGPMLYAIVEGTEGGSPVVKLVAVTIDGTKNPKFPTTQRATVRPDVVPDSVPKVKEPTTQTVARGEAATFEFDRKIKALRPGTLRCDPDPEAGQAAPPAPTTQPAPTLSPDNRAVSIPTVNTGMGKGRYKVSFSFDYGDNKHDDATVHIVVKE